ncbi:MAG: glycosyltransferase [Candidatus Aenigmarchaeota archaeon]|nr:glycosyltransferase [Candidatus Aenigmarchaeota archaeon]
MKILYAVCSWGLGHLTRSLPIIKKLAEENEIFVVSTGRTLVAARHSLIEENVKFIDIPDYPQPFTKNPSFFFLKFSFCLPAILNNIRKEHEQIEKIVRKEKIKLIVSDSKYGIFSKVPSYFIAHQLRFIAPFGMTYFTEYFNSKLQKKFNKILVPDFPDFENSLSGDLSHNLKFFNKNKIVYFGAISSFHKRNLKEDVDVFISISGPEVQRKVFEETVLNQVGELNGKIVVSLGTPEKKFSETRGNAQIYSYLENSKREELLNRSKIVVTRSGYSTIMDLAETGRKALFVPTKNQTEQEYLGEFHLKRKNFYCISQDKLNLKEDLKKAKKYNGLNPKWNTKKSLKIFLDTLFM